MGFGGRGGKGTGGKKGGRGGYNWRKHLPADHPERDATLLACADPEELRARKTAWREGRAAARAAADNALLEDLGMAESVAARAAEAATMTSAEKAAAAAEHEEQTRQRQAFDPHPQPFTLPAPLCRRLRGAVDDARAMWDQVTPPQPMMRRRQLPRQQPPPPPPPQQQQQQQQQQQGSKRSRTAASTDASKGSGGVQPAIDELSAAMRAHLLAQEQRAATAAGGSFSRLQAQRRQLPACSRAAEIVATLAAHRVVVVSGETGCGKTTQVPQLLLDAEIRAGRGSQW